MDDLRSNLSDAARAYCERHRPDARFVTVVILGEKGSPAETLVVPIGGDADGSPDPERASEGERPRLRLVC